MTKPVFYLSDIKKCDLCEALLSDAPGTKMYDARVYPGGPWGNLCSTCWECCGRPLGVGRGQEYVRTDSQIPTRRWMQTAGSEHQVKARS